MYGQLGITDKSAVIDQPFYVDYFEEDIVGVACGYDCTLFLTESHRLYACGKNDKDQLGVASRGQNVSEPLEIRSIDEEVGSVSEMSDFG